MNELLTATKSTRSSAVDQSVTQAVVAAIADADGVSPVELTPPLYEAIDPDALETVVASMTSGPDEPAGRVEFAYSGYEVVVTEGGEVSVTPSESPR